MNKSAVAGACVRCARPSLTLLALRNKVARIMQLHCAVVQCVRAESCASAFRGSATRSGDWGNFFGGVGPRHL